MAIADVQPVQRASGRVYGIQYTCRRHVSTRARVYERFSIYFYVHRMMQCTVAKLLLEVMIFLSCRDRVTLRSVTRPTYQTPQPVCYVRRGNLLLPAWELAFRTERFSHASRWKALLSPTRVEKLRSTTKPLLHPSV